MKFRRRYTGNCRSHWRGRVGAAGRRAGAVPGAGGASAEVRLPVLYGRGRAGAGAGPADPGRAAHRGDRGPCAGVEVRRSPAAVPPGPDLRAPGRCPGSLDLGRLGGARRLPAASRARTAARHLEGVAQTVRRRDDGAGARSGAWTDQDRPCSPMPGTIGRGAAAIRPAWLLDYGVIGQPVSFDTSVMMVFARA